mgnify:FL=1
MCLVPTCGIVVVVLGDVKLVLVKGVVVDVVVVFNVSIDVVFVLDFGFADDVIDEIGDVVVFDIVSDVR